MGDDERGTMLGGFARRSELCTGYRTAHELVQAANELRPVLVSHIAPFSVTLTLWYGMTDHLKIEIPST